MKDEDLYRRFVRACNGMNDRGELPEGWDDIEGDGGSTGMLPVKDD